MPAHTFSGGGRNRSTWVNMPASPNRIWKVGWYHGNGVKSRAEIEVEEKKAKRKRRRHLLRLKRMTPAQRKKYLSEQRRLRRVINERIAERLRQPGYVPSPGAIEFERRWKDKYDPHKLAYRNGIVTRPRDRPR
jgi:hypothetical protein